MPRTMSVVKASKSKPGTFEHAVSMLKLPTGSVYIGNRLYYPIYLYDPFPRGLDLEGSSTFQTLILSMWHQ